MFFGGIVNTFKRQIGKYDVYFTSDIYPVQSIDNIECSAALIDADSHSWRPLEEDMQIGCVLTSVVLNVTVSYGSYNHPLQDNLECSANCIAGVLNVTVGYINYNYHAPDELSTLCDIISGELV